MDVDVNIFMEEGRTQMRHTKAADEAVKSGQEAAEKVALRAQRRSKSTVLDSTIQLNQDSRQYRQANQSRE
jgi:hypothetical protein